jgi:hypothetical protein
LARTTTSHGDDFQPPWVFPLELPGLISFSMLGVFTDHYYIILTSPYPCLFLLNKTLSHYNNLYIFNIMKIPLSIFCLLIMIIPASCAKLPTSKNVTQYVKIGISNKNDIKKLFGVPFRTETQSSEQTEKWIYGRSQKVRISKMANPTETIFTFNQKGVVQSYEVHE